RFEPLTFFLLRKNTEAEIRILSWIPFIDRRLKLHDKPDVFLSATRIYERLSIRQSDLDESRLRLPGGRYKCPSALTKQSICDGCLGAIEIRPLIEESSHWMLRYREDSSPDCRCHDPSSGLASRVSRTFRSSHNLH